MPPKDLRPLADLARGIGLQPNSLIPYVTKRYIPHLPAERIAGRWWVATHDWDVWLAEYNQLARSKPNRTGKRKTKS